MKIVACVRNGQALQKLVWFNESKGGVYLGVFARELDVHLSYHRDGRKHTKIGTDYIQRTQDTPLESFSGAKHLSHQAISIDGRSDSFWPRHAAFKTWDVTLVFDESQLLDSEWLALDFWLFESKLFFEIDSQLRELGSRYANFRLLTTYYHQLVAYPNLSMGIVFRAARDFGGSDA